MNTINAKTLRNELKVTLEKVRDGEELVVIYNSKPIAKLSPINQKKVKGNGRQILHSLKKFHQSIKNNESSQNSDWKIEYYLMMEKKHKYISE